MLTKTTKLIKLSPKKDSSPFSLRKPDSTNILQKGMSLILL